MYIYIYKQYTYNITTRHHRQVAVVVLTSQLLKQEQHLWKCLIGEGFPISLQMARVTLLDLTGRVLVVP